ncbi:bleomycin resistance protein [Nocardioides sp. Root1257]|uniref:VOC family protein n=1 Tax=unclassified Nocardioides TaxID=2615069 RepID=UPI00070185F7|nr:MULTISPECIES: VOC family protein [unclassified Nocardioides]KQW53607.1 bleomycin resistance protein [Nocardioides sp. Root1257]KRC56293.1 bleomycin resistance protein [Nocardioides sp. Root224]
MTAAFVALEFDAADAGRLARFWAGVLGRDIAPDGVTLLPDGDPGFEIRFVPNPEPKVRPNQMHFDLTSSSLADQQATVERALDLGGRHLDVGQLPEEDHVVLADPEGNEFCVVGPDNGFLRDTGVIGCLSCDGSRAVGLFWHEILGWPLVWDEGEETAIQSPRGGSKISWGGPQDRAKTGANRLRPVLAVTDVDRLLDLGATHVDGTTYADPDGNELHLSGTDEHVGA